MNRIATYRLLNGESAPNSTEHTSESRRRALACSVMLVCLTFASGSWGQAPYPTKAIRVVVPVPAGSSPDVIARYWSDQVAKATGQPVIVDNRPGASTIIGAQAVATAPADGYTLLYAVANTISINPYIFKNLPYKAEDFVPVSQILTVPMVLIVSTTSPFKTLQDVIRAAKEKPGKVNYASYGTGTVPHVALVRFLNATGISMSHIPYKDGGMTDVMSGTIDVSLEPSTTAIPQIKAGKLRALAVSGPKRVDALPDVPAVAEIIPGFVGESWHGVMVAKGTPPEVVSKLAALSQTIISSEDFRKKLHEFALVPAGGTPTMFQKFLTEDAKAWAKVIKDNEITVE